MGRKKALGLRHGGRHEALGMRHGGLVVAALLALLVGGCSTLGNGKIDPPAFDVDVAWVSEDGRVFRVVNDANGVDLQGTFIEPKTGLVFTLGEGIGSLTIRDPSTGLQTTIVPKPSGDSPTP